MEGFRGGQEAGPKLVHLGVCDAGGDRGLFELMDRAARMIEGYLGGILVH